MKTTLEEIAEISPIDEHFGRLITRLGGDERVAAAARLLSAARSLGHTCVPLSELDQKTSALKKSLEQSPVAGPAGAWQPLILDEKDRLYLQRYWRYEQDLAHAIRTRLAAPAPELDKKWVDEELDRLLPIAAPETADQRRAVLSALGSRFCVITGGPGTGKTRTVSVILSLLLRDAARTDREPPRIALAAPTGKAAARLTESIHAALGDGPDSAVLPVASTLHRLLGLQPQSSAPRYDAKNPLSAEVVIVDEASMIDLSLMAKLFAAVPPTARLILLGDRDQLAASVEAGHVLGDMCPPRIPDAKPAKKASAKSAPKSSSLPAFVELQHNFRFASESGIHLLSRAINEGGADTAVQLLTDNRSAGLRGHPLPAPSALPALLRDQIVAIYRQTIAACTPLESLAALGTFRILCALRGGPYGVENINRLAEGALAAAGLVHPNSRQYPGRPIMVTQNDYHLGLFNGDIGVLLPDPEADGELRAFFSAPGQTVRSIHPSRLPAHETVWAMTVHKSQGSEFARILLLLPDRDSELLTRELAYTAITRARDMAEVWFCAPILRAAIARQTVRFSGLRDALAKNSAV